MKMVLSRAASVLGAGLLIILPAYLALLLVFQMLAKLAGITKPISVVLPAGIDHPALAAAVALLVFCFFVGLLVQTRPGRELDRVVTQKVLGRIPGYGVLRSIADQVTSLEAEAGFKPALIDVEDHCLSPAFLIEDHGDGRCTVFVPSVPTPMAGSILIMQRERVLPLDVPLPVMMSCISKWGAGSGELLAALEKSRSA